MPYQNFMSALYHILPLMMRNILEFDIVFQGLIFMNVIKEIFIFTNLMTHIICRHYVHMTHVKFLQKTDQMNKYQLRNPIFLIIYLDKDQMSFALSSVRASSSRTSNIDLWRLIRLDYFLLSRLTRPLMT